MSEASQDLYEVRIYLKSGNVVELSNLLSFDWKKDGFTTSVTWKHHHDDNTFNLLGGNSLDLDSVEAITHRKQFTFRRPEQS
jgi:hypothetical protein